MKLLQELFAQGYISEEKMKEIEDQAVKSNKRIEEIILEEKIVEESYLFDLKSKVLNIPIAKINSEEIPSEVLELIPEEASGNYKMMAFEKDGNKVKIGMVYPEDISAQNALRFLSGQENFVFKNFLITPKDFEKLSKERKNLTIETNKALESLEGEAEKILSAPKKEKSSFENISEEAPIIKMVMVILRHALESEASDIHIEPGREKLRVRFRLNGVLKPTLFLPLNVHPAILARIKILSGLKIDENRLPQDGRFSTKINEKMVDFRVATFPTLYGEKVELRLLDSSTGARSFEDLGISGRSLEVIKEAIKKPYGLILFTGPTGSGKTTSQYAILRILNQTSVNVVTVEDPIEYSIDGINQSQVNPEIGYTFASGLRQILRQDPNVIMVGEIRDEETASLAINAALTGHVVLSTLHTNTSVGVVPRLLDMGIRPFLIPATLRLVISQRLIRALCPNCKIKIKPSPKVRDYILEKYKNLPLTVRKEINLEDPLMIYSVKGCEKCNSTGYSGRKGLFEVLSMNEELAELIQKNPSEGLILKMAKEQGMLTMDQEGIIKVLKGETSIEEVTRVTEER